MNQKQLPAFPIPLQPGQPYSGHAPCDGMTIRDYFAAKAMQGMLSNPEFPQEMDIASAAFELADAMLRARDK